MSTPQAITELLVRWSEGNRQALDELMPVVQSELKRLARGYLRRERANHTLQPTALINEAYMRLIDQRSAGWQNRAQFFGIAAQLMRRILVDHARAHKAEKRGGNLFAVSLTHADSIGTSPDTDLLAVHEALERLQHFDEQQARIIEYRFFAGLTIEETASALNISHATVERDWAMAKAWLKRELTR